MTADDTRWIIWGMGTCVFFGLWQESIYAGLFMFYLIVFGLMTIEGWDDDEEDANSKVQ
jgi:hypothetical protein